MFEVGQKVLCIRNDPGDDELGMHIGSVYTVLQVWDTIDGPGMDVEECAPNDEWLWGCEDFRPLNDPSIELFREMAKKEFV